MKWFRHKSETEWFKRKPVIVAGQTCDSMCLEPVPEIRELTGIERMEQERKASDKVRLLEKLAALEQSIRPQTEEISRLKDELYPRYGYQYQNAYNNMLAQQQFMGASGLGSLSALLGSAGRSIWPG